MKRIFAIILALMLLVSLAACGEQKTDKTATVDEATEAVSGGWTVNEALTAVMLPSEVQTAFDKAVGALDGMDYSPVAYIGSQVVAGMNYAVLCKAATVTAEPVISLKVLIIYADLNGNAEVTNVADFNIADYAVGEGKTPEQLAGGWSAPEEVVGSGLSTEADAAYDKAMDGYAGGVTAPLAELGTQVVAGTNYAILSHCIPVTENSVPCIQVVNIYSDLDGNAEINNVCTLDIADFTA